MSSPSPLDKQISSPGIKTNASPCVTIFLIFSGGNAQTRLGQLGFIFRFYCPSLSTDLQKGVAWIKSITVSVEQICQTIQMHYIGLHQTEIKKE